ncbi:hypothetical protein ES703_75182 [subsurface metagenome]
MVDKSCWRWVDWTPCYKMGDTSHGNKVELDGWCPECGSMRLRAPGYTHNKPLNILETPHFEPDFKGAVKMFCPAPGCGYEASFYIDVPKRKVLIVSEVLSRELP